nr:MAG TPA: hypothetical protein [Caudoviricetes sp.]
MNIILRIEFSISLDNNIFNISNTKSILEFSISEYNLDISLILISDIISEYLLILKYDNM